MLRVQEAPDLGIPEVKPAIESIRGRWHRKMSPKTQHSMVQARLAALFLHWAGDRGAVGTEWRYYFLPEDEKPSSLVPDLAYLAHERMPPPGAEAEVKYLDADFRVLRPGSFVRCAVTGQPIPLDELRYWSAERQEAYAGADIALARLRELGLLPTN